MTFKCLFSLKESKAFLQHTTEELQGYFVCFAASCLEENL